MTDRYITPAGYNVPILHIKPTKGDTKFYFENGIVVHDVFDGVKWVRQKESKQ